MRNIAQKMLLLSLFIFCLNNAFAIQSGWEAYRDSKYSFEMLVPKGTKFAEKEFGNGLGGLYAKNGAAEFFGLAKLGEFASLEEIEELGVTLSQVSEEHWEKVDEGSGNGWKSYRTYQAKQGNTVVYAGLGTGAKGSYLLMLKTTVEDVTKHEAEYKKWYAGLKLF